MKKVISMLLAVCLVLSLSAGVFAANMTPSVDKTVVKAGEAVKVTVSLDEDVVDVLTIAYKLYFNEDLFDVTSSKSLVVGGFVTVSNVKHNSTGAYVNFSTMDTTSEGEHLKAGDFVEITFTAKQDVTEQQASFTTAFENCMLKDFTMPTNHGAGPAATVTVKPASATVEGYTAAVSGGAEIRANENAVVNVTIDNEAETTYNAYAFTLTYDPAVVSYYGVNVADGIVIKDSNGTLTVLGYGADRTCGTPISFTFTGVAKGTTNVTLTTANVDKEGNAIGQDAPAATILAASAAITVGGDYTVTLPEYFTGADTVAPGADYTFTAKDTHYTYDFTGSTMGGETADVIDNGDGTFTVKNVTGDLVITATRKAMKYTVTVTGNAETDIQAAEEAIYGYDFSFLLKNIELDKYDYTVVVTVGGKVVTPAVNDNFLETMGSRTYKIAAADVTGDIVITANKTEKTPENTTINFVGTGSGDVAGGTTQTGKTGEDFTFSINAVEGYEYTVTLDGETLTAVGGVYTIPGAKLQGKDITVTVEKKSTAVVDVTEYLKLDGKTMFLVTVKGNAGEGKAFAYDGNAMFTSTKYDAAAYLVISDKSLEEVKAEAAGKVTIAAATAEAVTYDGDVNGTGKVDVNDAQLVYNMYNAKYGDFDSVSMLKFLRADVNGDKTVTVLDSAAIVDIILA